MNRYVEKLYNNPNLVSYSCDIVEHKEYLSNLAKDQEVVELGVRCGFSSACFLTSCKKLTSYDIDFTAEAQALKWECPSWSFNKESSLEIEIPECDILFIDTDHTYHQLQGELNKHHAKPRKYIVMHDTYLDGMRKALNEFLASHPEWKIEFDTSANNGLTTLVRIKT
jgi:hypothetical protein